MTVESATYISQLDPTYPAAGDPKSEGDNHLRLVKTVLKTQFPNFGTAAISATAAEVNYLVGVTSGVQTQLNTLTSAKAAKAGDTYTGAHDFTGGTIAVPTATVGDATTKAASTAFVSATAFNAALPGQTGNAGKFVSTDGVNAFWRSAIESYTPISTAVQVAVDGGRYSLQATSTEGAGTNLLLYSEQINNAAWIKIRSSVTANAVVSPGGTATADKISEDATASNSHFVAQNISPTTNSDPYTATVYLKAGERTFANMFVTEGATFARDIECTFNLSTGTAGAVVLTGGATGSASIENVGNGWYRCCVTATLGGSDTSIQLRIRLANPSGVVHYTGDGSSGVYAWGAQIEAGASRTSYILSEASPGTRAAGIVPPQRLVLPALPASDAYVAVHIGNNITTNIVDPNGWPMEANAIPVVLNVRAGVVGFQFFNGSWRIV